MNEVHGQLEFARDAWCGELHEGQVGEQVRLMGWIQRRRDLGGLIFVDLRDRSGICQIVFNPQTNPEAHRLAGTLRSEYVVAIRGYVRMRTPETINPNLPTGRIEVEPEELVILNRAKTPPFPIEDHIQVDETVRLHYRYLDLRRPSMLKNLVLRHRVVKTVRDFFDQHGFLEIETPMLTRSTPEGARDFLVPTRQAGEFYALPQSPQLFKQILMVSGVDRYVQIARCFRDEDLRADRQPEFTQIDLEMSFVTRDEIMNLMEQLMKQVFAVIGYDLALPLPRMTYDEAMLRYGSDKPDLRFGMEIHEVSDLFAESSFRVFQMALASQGVIRAIVVPGGAQFSRKEMDDLTQFAVGFGAKGLAWVAWEGDDQLRSPIAKFISDREREALRDRLQPKAGDLLLMVADQAQTAAEVLGQLRLHLAERLNLIPSDSRFKLVWITDFPMFEWDAEENRWQAKHNPFTSPLPEDLPLLQDNPGQARSLAYDLVMDGVEIGGGSLRN